MAGRKKNLPGGVAVGGLFDAVKKERDQAIEHRALNIEHLPAGSRVFEFRGGDGRDWRVERWEEFLAEVMSAEWRGAGAEKLKAAIELLHLNLTSKGNERAWLMVRRLFGFMPVRIGLGDDPEQWRMWSPGELCGELGMNAEQFQEEMRALRVGVMKVLGATNSTGGNREERLSDPRPTLPDLIETDVELLARHGYSASMFEAMTPVRYENEKGKGEWTHKARESAENLLEMKWFCGRLREVEKLMTRPMTAQLARNVLMHELRMRRAETHLFKFGAGTAEHDAARAEHDKAEEAHAKLISKIDEVAPWFNVSGKEANLTASVGDIIKGIQDWRARQDKKLVDGLFTAAGIQVLLRTSKQFEDPRYRLGWNLAVMESRKGVFDPNWRPQFKERDLRKLDRGFKDGVLAVMEEDGEEPIDLLKDEFEELGPDGGEEGMTNDEMTNDESGNEKSGTAQDADDAENGKAREA
jgi:hypothetical protein